MKRLLYYIAIIGLFLTSSCSDWLDVKPKQNAEEDELFSTEVGFQNALIGVYLSVKSKDLYGETLTYDFVEYLSQHWKTTPNSKESSISAYDYKNINVEPVVTGIYAKMYNTIINIDNILKFIDNGTLNPKMKTLIKGESLGLRAYLQFDLLRLFGPIPTMKGKEPILAYVHQVIKQAQPIHTWDQYIAFLEKDLNDAEVCLKEIDENIPQGDFYSSRTNRMNYWTILALKARFYQWIGEQEKALKYANLLINDSKFRLTTGVDYTKGDLLASNEILFGILIHDFAIQSNDYFFQPAGVSQEKTLIDELFATDITDYRRTKLWKELTFEHGSKYSLMKYKQEELPTSAQKTVPMIRLYEMYLIALQCSDDASFNDKLMAKMVESRNISVYDIATPQKKQEFISNEYHKEFYGEGQCFFQDKLLNSKTIRWSEKEGSKEVYILPLPINE